MYKHTYEQKVMNFIEDNSATEANNKVAKTFKKEVRKTINECKQLIDNSKKWNMINLNPPPNTQRTDQNSQRKYTD
jgi:hypothetical protein